MLHRSSQNILICLYHWLVDILDHSVPVLLSTMACRCWITDLSGSVPGGNGSITGLFSQVAITAVLVSSALFNTWLPIKYVSGGHGCTTQQSLCLNISLHFCRIRHSLHMFPSLSSLQSSSSSFTLHHAFED